MRRTKHWKGLVGLAALVLLLCAAVGGTLAWMTAETEPVKNTFTPATVTTTITENTQNNEKRNIQVNNTGDVEAYVRAAIAMAWVDEKTGKPVGSTANLPDLSTLTLSTGWVKGSDGIYYYTKPVAADGGETPALFSEAITEKNAPTGCHLQVTVLAEAIQSLPADAFNNAWGSSGLKAVSDGANLTTASTSSD